MKRARLTIVRVGTFLVIAALGLMSCGKAPEAASVKEEAPVATSKQDELAKIAEEARAYYVNDSDPGSVAPANALASEVQLFIETREACDHWRGEEPYDEPRAEVIREGEKKTCVGTDAELARLRAKYVDDEAVTAALKPFDASIE